MQTEMMGVMTHTLDAQSRINESLKASIGELAARQSKTEESLAGLAAKQSKTEEALARLAEAGAQSERRLDTLRKIVEKERGGR
jgi:hypothetical protein